MVTRAGWLFHLSDGMPLPLDTDPAFQGTIDFRPNESAEQFVPDTPPEDDSLINQPLPQDPEEPKQLPRLLRKVKSKLHGRKLVVSFQVARPAKIRLIARKGREVVARSPMKRFSKGPGKLRVRVSRKRWPTKLEFKIRELARE